MESILFVSIWYILVSRICSTRSLAQTWITKFYCLHHLFVVPLSSGVAGFYLGRRGGDSQWPLLIATISFKKSQQFIDFSIRVPANLTFLMYLFAFKIFILPSPLPFWWPLESAIRDGRSTAWEFHQIERNIWVERLTSWQNWWFLIKTLFLRNVPSYWRYHFAFPRLSAVFFFPNVHINLFILRLVYLLVIGISENPVTQ